MQPSGMLGAIARGASLAVRAEATEGRTAAVARQDILACWHGAMKNGRMSAAADDSLPTHLRDVPGRAIVSAPICDLFPSHFFADELIDCSAKGTHFSDEMQPDVPFVNQVKK